MSNDDLDSLFDWESEVPKEVNDVDKGSCAKIEGEVQGKLKGEVQDNLKEKDAAGPRGGKPNGAEDQGRHGSRGGQGFPCSAVQKWQSRRYVKRN